jgi:hypothetical protein
MKWGNVFCLVALQLQLIINIVPRAYVRTYGSQPYPSSGPSLVPLLIAGKW